MNVNISMEKSFQEITIEIVYDSKEETKTEEWRNNFVTPKCQRDHVIVFVSQFKKATVEYVTFSPFAEVFWKWIFKKCLKVLYAEGELDQSGAVFPSATFAQETFYKAASPIYQCFELNIAHCDECL